MLNQIIEVNENNCIGCNKCIRHCPKTFANRSIQDEEEYKIIAEKENCIGCGACIAICSHDSRGFIDDTNQFLEDLSAKIEFCG